MAAKPKPTHLDPLQVTLTGHMGVAIFKVTGYDPTCFKVIEPCKEFPDGLVVFRPNKSNFSLSGPGLIAVKNRKRELGGDGVIMNNLKDGPIIAWAGKPNQIIWHQDTVSHLLEPARMVRFATKLRGADAEPPADAKKIIEDFVKGKTREVPPNLKLRD